VRANGRGFRLYRTFYQITGASDHEERRRHCTDCLSPQ
jgi:hypothetical protein